MWIYKKTEKGASLINTDHVKSFIIKDGEVIAVYDSFRPMPDGRQLKTSVAKVGSEQEARDFIQWLAEHLGTYRGQTITSRGEKVVMISHDGARG